MVDIQIIEHVAIVAVFFFFNDTATTEIYTLSLHDALPIYKDPGLAVEQNAAMIEPGLEQATEAFKKTVYDEVKKSLDAIYSTHGQGQWKQKLMINDRIADSVLDRKSVV